MWKSIGFARRRFIFVKLLKRSGVHFGKMNSGMGVKTVAATKENCEYIRANTGT